MVGNPSRLGTKRPVDVAHVHAMINSLPAAIESRWLVEPGAVPTTIHQGDFTLAQGTRRVKLHGVIALHWSPKPEVRFEGSPASGQPSLDFQEAQLRTTAHGFRGRAMVLGKHLSDTGNPLYTGICPRAILGQRRTAKSVQFQLVNFPKYVGRSIRFGPTGRASVVAGRLSFRAHGWRVDLDQDPSCSHRLMNVLARGGYATTHVGLIRRTSGREIPFSQAEDFLCCLNFFYAFLSGHWSGPILSAGLGKTSQLWERMGSWMLTASAKPRSWFPETSPLSVEPLLGAFRHLWLDQLWGQALRMTIHWYVHANAEASVTENAIVAAFIPLELLAWLVVVEYGGHMSAKKFGKLSTAGRLEKLLSHSGIPLSVTKDLSPRLHRSALARRKGNGPRSLAAVRNALVHPRRQKRLLLWRLSPIVLYELKELALSYIELSLLRALNYTGPYLPRAHEGWKGDHLRRVPWA